MFLTEQYEQVIILEVERIASLLTFRTISKSLPTSSSTSTLPVPSSGPIPLSTASAPGTTMAKSPTCTIPVGFSSLSLIVARLFRSDFFPGLGWMLTRTLWEELGPTWPGAYWDDWLRHPNQRKNRGCIRPEVSRSYTFGEMGTSNSQ